MTDESSEPHEHLEQQFIVRTRFDRSGAGTAHRIFENGVVDRPGGVRPMKILRHALICAAACAATILIPSLSFSQEPMAGEQTFVNLQHDWAEARKSADMHFLESFYVKEFTAGIMSGGDNSRAQDLAMFSSGDLKPTVIADRAMHVYIYGETAMVTGIEHLEGSYKGNTGPGLDLRFTNVFVHRDGRWQIVRHQGTQIRNGD